MPIWPAFRNGPLAVKAEANRFLNRNGHPLARPRPPNTKLERSSIFSHGNWNTVPKSRGITLPHWLTSLAHIVFVMHRLAEGHTDTAIPGWDPSDELRDVALAVEMTPCCGWPIPSSGRSMRSAGIRD